jgi:hypothetical protein
MGSKVQRVCRADNLTTIRADCLDIVGSLTFYIFIEHLQIISISNNNSSQIYTIYNSLWCALSLLSVLCLHQCPLLSCSCSQQTSYCLDCHLKTQRNSTQLSTDRLRREHTSSSSSVVVSLSHRSDYTENTTLSSSSVVAVISHGHCLQSHYLAMGAVLI